MGNREIQVYVRKNGSEERTISFERIPEISDKLALDLGFAIDGNSLIVSVRADVERAGKIVHKGCMLGSVPEYARPLLKVLADTERLINSQLGAFNYQVIFT